VADPADVVMRIRAALRAEADADRRQWIQAVLRSASPVAPCLDRPAPGPLLPDLLPSVEVSVPGPRTPDPRDAAC
jgi:hypothetical protein